MTPCFIYSITRKLYKSFERFHAGFYVNVCQGYVDCGGAYVGVAEDSSQGFNVFCLAVVLQLWGAPHKRHYGESYIMGSEAIIVR